MPLYFLVPSAGPAYARSLSHILGNLALLPMAPKPIIGVSWTLVLEMTFYTLFGLAIINRGIGRAVFAAWFGGIVWLNFIRPAELGSFGDYLFGHEFLDFFGGMAVAGGLQFIRPKLAPACFVALAGVAGLFVAPHIVAGVHPGDQAPLPLSVCYALSAMAIVGGAVGMDRAGLRAPAPLVRLGDATYSIYLVHWLVGWVIEAADHKLHLSRVVAPEVLFLAMTSLMLAAGVLVYHFAERPLLGATKDVWRWLQSRKPPVLQGA